MYFLFYDGDIKNTRLQVPLNIRKKGLWVTYINLKGNVVTEWYNNNSVEDKDWENSDNWIDGSNMLSGDLAISSEGYWVINGVNTKLPARGKEGITPLLRGFNGKLQVSYNNGESFNYLDLPTFVKEDNEDIKAIIDSNGIKELKFADKAYNPAEFSGLGRVILRKNIVQGKNILTQEMINKPNTVYEIRYDFDLNDTTINVPENCTLNFQGGSLSNGVINITKPSIYINGRGFYKCNIKTIKEIYTKWFILKLYNEDELADFFQYYIDNNNLIIIEPNIKMNIGRSVFIKNKNARIIGEYTINRKDYPTIIFNNSDGFVWNTKIYSQDNLFIRLNIIAKGYCFNLSNGDDEINRAYNIYMSRFEHLTLKSETKDCIYAHNNRSIDDNRNDRLCFQNIFNDIFLETTRYGINGVNGLGNVFNNICDYNVKESLFHNVYGEIKNCNTSFSNTKHFLSYDAVLYPNHNIHLSIQNCNIEKYSGEIIYWDWDVLEKYTYNVIIENTTIIYTPIKELDFLYSDKEIKFYPITFKGLGRIRLNNFDVHYLEGITLNKDYSLIRWSTGNKPLNVITDSFYNTHRVSKDTITKYIFQNLGNSIEFNSFVTNNYKGANSIDRFQINKEFKTLKTFDIKNIIDVTEYDNLYTKNLVINIANYNSFICSKDVVLHTLTLRELYEKKLFQQCIIQNDSNFNITFSATNENGIINRNFLTKNGKNIILHPNEILILDCIKIDNTIIIKERDVINKVIRAGASSLRPQLTNIDNNFKYFDTTINKEITWNGNQWIDNDNPINVLKKGTTAQRPTGVQIGFTYKDTDLNKWIIWNGDAWENIDGTALG